MQRSFLTRLAVPVLLLGSVVAVPTTTAYADPTPPIVVPNPQSWTAATGTFTLAGSAHIVVASPALSVEAAVLAEDLLDLTGLALPITTSAAVAGDIVLTVDSTLTGIGDEGYQLTIGSTVDIRGTAATGVFYGTRTALQVLKQEGESRRAMPYGTFLDQPAYRERGLMLDTARRFFSVAFLQQYVRQLAWLKMNTLHLHLSDDQGFRIESSVPGLTSPDHYTKAQITDLVAYAHRYHVTIIPEIDVPAHAIALTAARPDLLHTCPNMRATGDLDLTNPDTLPFVESLIDEFVPLFDADTFHIGADEYTYFTKSRANQLLALNSCAEIVAKAAALGYSDPGDLYRDFINALNTHLKAEGKKTRVWEWFDYVGSKPIDNDIVYDAWLGENGIQSKSDAGFDIVNSSYHYLYIIPGRSAPDDADLYLNWQPWIWSTAAEGRLTDPDDPHLLGAKLHVWCDGLFTPAVPEEQLDREISTTLKVFAERIWGSPQRSSYAAFTTAAAAVGNAPGYGTGQVLGYRFESSTADYSGAGNDGTIYGAPAYVTGRNSGALEFHGGSDRVYIGAKDLAPDWTLSFWVNRGSSGTNAAKLLDSAKFGVRLEQVDTGGKVGLTEYGVADWAFNYSAPVGTWTHLAIVGTSTLTTLYVNGAATDTIPHGFSLPMKWLGGTTKSINGQLDDLKIYRRALGPTAVGSLYQGLVAALALDDVDAVSATDGSGLGDQGGFKGPSREAGKNGTGLRFHGGDDFLYLEQPDISGNWTAAVWVQRTDLGQPAEVLMHSPQFSLRTKQLSTGRVGLSKLGVADYSYSYTLPADGSWHHLAFVGDTTGTSLYVDGVFSEKLSVRINLPMRTIGKIGNSLTGVVDDVIVYDRALTAAEVAALAV
ncbi:family 20 glycosylhydrolase [Hamadaea sp. NPDC051192]|uniref:family 20 glycosylhydrolase n=1 Tax=Hamadaea sp. NPDC051192 TaxID=3154940 RepID=UPI003444D414